jgi:hypothetical protein
LAQRRMFSLKIIDTDLFLDMPITARLLYYDLSMRADDDGFVASPKKIQKMIGCSDDDLKILIAKQFVIPFQSGVCVIKHWKIHNLIRSDRYTETEYKQEKSMLVEVDSKYEIEGVNGMQNVIPNGNQMEPQVRLGQVRSGEDRVGQDNTIVNEVFDYYCEVFKGLYTRLTLTDKRKSHIKARLTEGYTVEQIKQAISNIRTSSFHCGENDKGMMYATIEFICRSSENLERWVNHIPKKSTNTNTNKALELYQKALKEEEDAKE